jgi:hypothetical protein
MRFMKLSVRQPAGALHLGVTISVMERLHAAMHPEVRAYIEVEQLVRRRQAWLQAAAAIPAIVVGLKARAMTHVALGHGVEPHLGAAFELVAFVAPLVASVALAREWLRRWAQGGGLQLAARVAARHRVSPSVVRDALDPR